MKLIATFTVILLLLSLKTSAYAQDFSLEVKPSIIELNRLENTEKSIKLINKSQQNIKLTPKIFPIKGTEDKKGTILIGSDPKTESMINESIRLRENGEFVNSIILEPLESTSIDLVYQNHQNTDNDIIFTIVFLADEASQSTIESSYSEIVNGVGTIIILRNPNTEANDIKVKSFTTNTFYKKGPIKFNSIISNPNNSISKINSYISIYNIINQEVGRIDLGEQYILPQTELKLTTDGSIPHWNDSILLGPYKARLVLSVNETQTIIEEAHFWVLPLIYLVPLSIFLFFMLSVYLRIIKKIKS